MKNIHVIASPNPSRLILQTNGKLRISDIILRGQVASGVTQNIYITSDEEIKEENLTKEIYVIDTQTNNIGKLTCKNRFFKGSSKLIEVEWKNKQNIWNYYHIKKIILTTDQDLIKDGVQSIPDEFLEWFVKNSSCEEIEVEKWFDTSHIDLGCGRVYHNNPKIPLYKIIIPKEEPKQETLEEVMESYLDSPLPHSYRLAVEFGIKWQQKNSYSEEEVLAFGKFCIDKVADFLDGKGDQSDSQEHSMEELFEKFKKK